MTALLRLHIKKLLSDERRKLFKTQITLTRITDKKSH